jgi:hypothetical protein
MYAKFRVAKENALPARASGTPFLEISKKAKGLEEEKEEEAAAKENALPARSSWPPHLDSTNDNCEHSLLYFPSIFKVHLFFQMGILKLLGLKLSVCSTPL